MSRRAEIFSPAVRRTVIVVASLSAIAAVIAIVWGAKLAAPAPRDSDSFSRSPVGHRAFHDSLRELGVHVLRGRRGDVLSSDAPTLFLEPETETFLDGERLTLATAIASRQDLGYGTLVALPKWAMATGEDGEDRAVAVSERAHDVLTAATGVVGTVGHLGSATEVVERQATGPLGTFTVSVPWLQTVEVPGSDVLLAVDGHPIAVWHESGAIILSDPDILHSYNHHRAQNADVALALVRDFGSDAVVIDEVFHGHGQQRSLAAALGEFPAYLILAQGLLLALLVVIRGGHRFGPAEPEPGLGKGPAESIAVSAAVLARGRSRAALLRSYLEEVLADIADQLQLQEGDAAHVAAQIDAVSKRRGESAGAADLLARASALAATPRPRPEEVLELARRGHRLHRRLTRRDVASPARDRPSSHPNAESREPMEITEAAS